MLNTWVHKADIERLRDDLMLNWADGPIDSADIAKFADAIAALAEEREGEFWRSNDE